MELTICIGSSCHLKGSQKIVEQLQELLDAHGLNDRVTISGAFCMGNCMNGVCVKLDGEFLSLQPAETKRFFEKEVLTRL